MEHRIAFVPLAIGRVAGAPPGNQALGVLARQLPALAARGLSNAGHAARFLPFVGRQGERSGFVGFDSLMAPDEVANIPGPTFSPELVVDGLIDRQVLQVRVVHAGGGFVVRTAALPFDLGDPGGVLRRYFESLADEFAVDTLVADEWAPLAGDQVMAWLEAEDQALALDANLTLAQPAAVIGRLSSLLVARPGFRRGWSLLTRLASAAAERGGGEAQAAVAALEAVAPAVPSSPDVLRDVGELLWRFDRTPTATRLGQRLVALDPTDARTALRVAEALIRTGNEAGAAAVLAGPAQAVPGDPLVLAQAALLADQRGLEKERNELTDRLGSCSRMPPPATRALAVLECRRGRFAQARRALETALGAGASEPHLRVDLARVLLLDRRGDEARSLLEDLRRGGPVSLSGEVQQLLRIAAVPGLLEVIDHCERALSSGDLAYALKIARAAQRIAPFVPEPWLLLGKTRVRLGHPRRGVRMLRRALSLLPSLSEARNLLGITLVSLGRFREAYEHLRLAVVQMPGLVGPMIHLAQACYYLRRFDEGEEWLQKAEAASPGHPTVLELRARFFPAVEARHG